MFIYNKVKINTVHIYTPKSITYNHVKTKIKVTYLPPFHYPKQRRIQIPVKPQKQSPMQVKRSKVFIVLGKSPTLNA